MFTESLTSKQKFHISGAELKVMGKHVPTQQNQVRTVYNNCKKRSRFLMLDVKQRELEQALSHKVTKGDLIPRLKNQNPPQTQADLPKELLLPYQPRKQFSV